ncbi:hypothetical protein Q0O86_14040, partial [Staphylococcus aureus]|nr:hypothetical protein [Staphylococcus aureus]
NRKKEAISEPNQDPKQTKGIVRPEGQRNDTQGTLIDQGAEDDKQNNKNISYVMNQNEISKSN